MSEMDNFNLTDKVVDGDTFRDADFAEQGANLLEKAGLSARAFFDESSKLYYVQNKSGEWVGRDKQTFSVYLKNLGYCPVARKEVS